MEAQYQSRNLSVRPYLKPDSSEVETASLRARLVSAPSARLRSRSIQPDFSNLHFHCYFPPRPQLGWQPPCIYSGGICPRAAMFGMTKGRWVMVAVLGLALCSPASTTESERKVLSKVKPAYPALAREINISGTVKIEAVITANGTVKAVRPLGGHPLLILSATDALRKWRYAPGPETTVIVEFQFSRGD